jgi:hypothetical protein
MTLYRSPWISSLSVLPAINTYIEALKSEAITEKGDIRTWLSAVSDRS